MSAQMLDQPVAAIEADPHARLSAALVISLLLWAPFGMAAMHGDLDVFDAGVRYLVAFLGCRVAIGGIAHLAASYRHLHATSATASVEEPAEMPDSTFTGRRASDA